MCDALWQHFLKFRHRRLYSACRCQYSWIHPSFSVCTAYMVKKVVDSRVHTLIKNCVQTKHRSFFVVVGDKGKDQVGQLVGSKCWQVPDIKSLLDCQLALASFTSSSHCSSIGTLVLQEGSRIHEVGWANMFTDHLLIDRLCFPPAIARSVKPRSSERSRRVFARPTLRILSSCSFLSLISATPTTRRHTRSLVTLMACVSCRILKPSLPTHWHVPLKQSKVVVWWFFFSRVWALLSNCTPWLW